MTRVRLNLVLEPYAPAGDRGITERESETESKRMLSWMFMSNGMQKTGT